MTKQIDTIIAQDQLGDSFDILLTGEDLSVVIGMLNYAKAALGKGKESPVSRRIDDLKARIMVQL